MRPIHALAIPVVLSVVSSVYAGPADKPPTPKAPEAVLEPSRAGADERLLRPAPPPDAGSRYEHVVAKLKTVKISLEFKDTPLSDALDFIRSFSGIDFVIDGKVRDKFQADQLKVSLTVRDLPLRSALKLMLEGRGLAATYRDGVILIILKEELDQQVTLRIYDVRDLLMKIQDHPGPVIELRPPSQTAGGVAGATFTLEEGNKTVLTEDFIVDLIKKTCTPGTWENQKASISMNNGLLMVVQNKRAHDEVQQLIGMLRQYR